MPPDIFYVDPTSGDNANPGTHPTGAWATLQNVMSEIGSSITDSSEIRIMDNGILTISAEIDSVSVSFGEIHFVGANASGEVDGSRPLIQCSTNLARMFDIRHGGYTFTNLIVDGSGLAVPFDLRAPYTNVVNCTAQYSDGLGFNFRSVTNINAFKCEARNNASAGFSGVRDGCVIYQCVSHSNSGVGFEFSEGSHALGCIAYNNRDSGFSIEGPGSFIVDCVSDNNGDHGVINTETSNSTQYLINSIITRNGHDGSVEGVRATAGSHMFTMNCIFGTGSFANNAGVSSTGVILNHSGIVDPLFNNAPSGNGFTPADVASLDYTVQENSPIRGSGMSLPAILLNGIPANTPGPNQFIKTENISVF